MHTHASSRVALTLIMIIISVANLIVPVLSGFGWERRIICIARKKSSFHTAFHLPTSLCHPPNQHREPLFLSGKEDFPLVSLEPRLSKKL